VTLGLSVLAVAAHAAPGGAEALELSRVGLLDGELWRLATGHLAHWSLAHLAWDAATFAALGALCESRSRRDTVLVLALAAAAVAPLVLAARPALASYRGLSALDVALFVLLAARIGGRLGAALVFLLLAKLLYEACTGAALFVDSPSGPVALVPEAHLAGAAAAALYAACRPCATRWADARRA
jgi:rhomboid family GlyGly-CTERM serine protease